MWPQEYVELKQIEDLLLCGICYEYMNTSVVTPCSHNYCSLCIRKYLHYKTQCPACFEETFEKDLRVNKVVDEIIRCYLQVRNKLAKCIRGVKLPLIEDALLDPVKCTPTKNSCLSIPSNEEHSRNISDCASASKVDSPCTTKSVQREVSSPSTSGEPRVPSMFTPKSNKNTKYVSCPVCKVDVPELNINRHLDDCLKRKTLNASPLKIDRKRKPLAKLVYRLMKDTELRKKLKEFGLPSQGDRKTLEMRIQRYITLYNAECDKQDPRPVSDVVKQCEEEENLESRMQKTSSIVNRLQVNRNAAENIIEKERRKYLEVNKDSFQELIAKAKNTATPKKPVRRTILSQDCSNNMNSPSKRQIFNDEYCTGGEDKASELQVLGCADIDFQDSDSNVTCPLQIYSSADPTSMLAIEVSNSSTDDIKRGEATPVKQGTDRSVSPVLAGPRDIIQSPHFASVKYKREKKRNNSGSVDIAASSAQDVTSKGASRNIASAAKFEDILESDSDEIVDDSPKRISLFQKVARSDRNDCLRRIDGNFTGVVKSIPTKVSEQKNREKISLQGHVLRDDASDVSSNDSTDYKHYDENRIRNNKAILDGTLCKSSSDALKLEKENRISPTETIEVNYALRKRSNVSPTRGGVVQRKKQMKSTHNSATGNTAGKQKNPEEPLVSTENNAESSRRRGRSRKNVARVNNSECL